MGGNVELSKTIRNERQASTHCSAISKKPCGSVNLDFLRARVRHLLAKIEADPKPNAKRQWDDYQALRRYVRDMKRSKGRSWEWPVAFALCCVVIFAVAMSAHRPTAYIYSAPQSYFRIVERIDDYDFVMQRVSDGKAQIPVVLHFCHDYKPLFEAGMTLQWLAYDDRGSCQSIAATDRGYVIVRDFQHMPILAGNCHNDFQHNRVVCDGKPQF